MTSPDSNVMHVVIVTASLAFSATLSAPCACSSVSITLEMNSPVRSDRAASGPTDSCRHVPRTE